MGLFRDIREAAAAHKKRPVGSEAVEEGAAALIDTQIFEITSLTQTAGRYPGTVYIYDADADTYTALTANSIWADTQYSAQVLQLGVKYFGRVVGQKTSDSLDILMALNPPMTLRGKLAGTLSNGSSATMTIWYYNGSTEATTSHDITVYDWKLATGQSVASGKEIEAYFDAKSNRWYLGNAECA